MYNNTHKTIAMDTANEIADVVAEKLFRRLKLAEYVEEIKSSEEQGELQPLSEFLKENSP